MRSPATGKQRYHCKDCGRRFVNGYTWKANDLKIKELIINMSHNGSGTRDIARVLKVAHQTVSNKFKKASEVSYVNTKFLKKLPDQQERELIKKLDYQVFISAEADA